MNTIISFGGWKYFDINNKTNPCKEIWCCDIIDYKWNKLKIEIPRQYLFYLNIYDTIIIALYQNDDGALDEIWLLDLLDINNGWFKSNKMPIKLNVNGWILPIRVNNYIHFVVGNNNTHFKLSIKQILPKTLRNKYGLMYQDIVNGYFKLIKQEFKIIYSLPIVLTHLIIRYYSDFK